MKSATCTFIVILTGLFLGSISASAQPVKPTQTKEQVTELTRQLESLAADFSTYLEETGNKRFLAAQIKAAPREYIMVMRDFLEMAASKDAEHGGELLFKMMTEVVQAEATMKKFAYPFPRLEVKLPVKDHRERVLEANVVYVAAVPLEDESIVRTVAGFAPGGMRIALSADRPPDIPTYVLTPAEEEALRPQAPLESAERPEQEKNPERFVDDYVGVPWLLITDKSEGWTCGDPEIYLRIKYWIWNYSKPNSSIYINSKVPLAYVNVPYVWYSLGELGYNSTYRYLIGKDYPFVIYEIWEEDSGGHGGDDFLGMTYVAWKTLPFGGYTPFNLSKGKIQVDRD